jgi:hypothetical protein
MGQLRTGKLTTVASSKEFHPAVCDKQTHRCVLQHERPWAPLHDEPYAALHHVEERHREYHLLVVHHVGVLHLEERAEAVVAHGVDQGRYVVLWHGEGEGVVDDLDAKPRGGGAGTHDGLALGAEQARIVELGVDERNVQTVCVEEAHYHQQTRRGLAPGTTPPPRQHDVRWSSLSLLRLVVLVVAPLLSLRSG